MGLARNMPYVISRSSASPSSLACPANASRTYNAAPSRASDETPTVMRSLFPHMPTKGYSAASRPPPQPRAYKPVSPEERVSRHPELPEETPTTTKPKPGLFSRIWPFTTSSTVINARDRDPARGMEAARRVVQDGVLDPRYKSAAQRYTAIIVALPLAIYLSYELYQRRFRGKQRRGANLAPAE